MKKLCLTIGLTIIILLGILSHLSRVMASHEMVWGTEVHHLAISLTTDRDSYKLGNPIDVAVHLRNTGDEVIDCPQLAHRFVLFDKTGAAVPLTETGQRWTNAFPFMGEILSSNIMQIPAHGTLGESPVLLSTWFTIDKPGIYYLLVMRSANNIVSVSNMVTIYIAK